MYVFAGLDVFFTPLPVDPMSAHLSPLAKLPLPDEVIYPGKGLAMFVSLPS